MGKSGGNRPLRIVVVGAGIGGLTAALALLQRGFEVTVLEQAAVLGEIGAGVQISPNGTKVLQRLGVGGALERMSADVSGKRIRLWNTGTTWKLFDLGAASRELYGAPYLMLHRADLHNVLVQAVRAADPDAIRLDSKVVHIEQEDERVFVQTHHGARIEADVAIGADGVHSRVRAAQFEPDCAHYSGIMAWRGIIRASDLPAHLSVPYGVNWVGPGGHVVHYPLRRGELVNLVAVIERNDWQVESWSLRGELAECQHDFSGWHEDVQTLISAVPEPFKWALMVRQPMQQWTRGRTALLGDACHPTLPFLGQGAVMAIEDGYVLARALERYHSDPEQGLRRYEQARVERATRVVLGSNENAKRFHNPVLASYEGAAAYVAREWEEERVKERYDWLFRYDVDEIAL